MTTTMVSASTPPPPSSIHTPPTPRLGWEDNYEPYSPRVSTRSQRARAVQTPPPQNSPLDLPGSSSLRSSKRGTSKNLVLNTPSSRSSPIASKKNTPYNSYTMGGRRVSGALTFDTTVIAAEALGITGAPDAMLPTPVKTPVNRSTKAVSGVSAIARNLFSNQDDEVMPTAKKTGRDKYDDSFEVEKEGPIQIFTDSHERIPEVDGTDDNPFYGDGAEHPEPTKRMSKRRKVMEECEGVADSDEYKDGMVYVFRGKKIFRKFSDMSELERSFSAASDDEDAVLEAAVPSHLRKPLTRSFIKPRLLFPSKHQDIEDEEEATTDIEEPMDITPKRQIHVSTPKAPKFAPFTPPTTVRTTRSKDVDMKTTTPKFSLHGGKEVRKVSPFNSWQRTKNGAAATQSKKREGETLTRGSIESKRLRSHA